LPKALTQIGVARLAVLEALGHQMGFMSGTRTRGPKPTRMSGAYPELHFVVHGKYQELENTTAVFADDLVSIPKNFLFD